MTHVVARSRSPFIAVASANYQSEAEGAIGNESEFVIDAYTRRVFGGLGLVRGEEEYDTLREMFESRLPRDAALYNEYHALIVEHARQFYSRKPYGTGDALPGLVRQWKAGRKK